MPESIDGRVVAGEATERDVVFGEGGEVDVGEGGRVGGGCGAERELHCWRDGQAGCQTRGFQCVIVVVTRQ